jgi:1-acyl-sn-glycerol-3-phosphate acyltransferase
MLRTLLHKSWRFVYGAYSLTALAVLVTFAALMALLVPRLAWRRALTRQLARLWLWLAGIRLTVRGADLLPEGSCVLIANHSSYLDGVVMKAALPPRFSFVIKREASSMPIMGFLLRRIGSEFVDRHTKGGRQRDAKRVVRRAEQGHSLVFFPEGTFDAVIGLKRFHIGAFVAAARGGMPLVPMVIHGARKALPNDTVVPYPGPVAVDVLAPLTMAECGGSAEGLRDVARARMVALLDYPDLAAAQTERGNATELRGEEFTEPE